MAFTAIIEKIKGNGQKKHGQCLYFCENEENVKVKARMLFNFQLFTDLIFFKLQVNL